MIYLLFYIIFLALKRNVTSLLPKKLLLDQP